MKSMRFREKIVKQKMIYVVLLHVMQNGLVIFP